MTARSRAREVCRERDWGRLGTLGRRAAVTADPGEWGDSVAAEGAREWSWALRRAGEWEWRL